MTRVSGVEETQNEQTVVPKGVHWHGVVLDDLWDGFLDHAPCQVQGILIEEVKADLMKQGLLYP